MQRLLSIMGCGEHLSAPVNNACCGVAPDSLQLAYVNLKKNISFYQSEIDPLEVSRRRKSPRWWVLIRTCPSSFQRYCMSYF